MTHEKYQNPHKRALIFRDMRKVVDKMEFDPIPTEKMDEPCIFDGKEILTPRQFMEKYDASARTDKADA